jgi:hypothetical protein
MKVVVLGVAEGEGYDFHFEETWCYKVLDETKWSYVYFLGLFFSFFRGVLKLSRGDFVMDRQRQSS